jgi:predicted ATP-grasp superfamily ATP-dependent carboligase
VNRQLLSEGAPAADVADAARGVSMKSNPSVVPPVLFLAPPRWYSAHCAARSLAGLGARVHMLRHRGISPSNLSRFCAGTFPAGDNGRPAGDPGRIVSDLQAAGRALGRGTVLIPGTDEWAVFIAEHGEQLAGTFRFPDQPPELVRSLASKDGLREIASKHGFPTPRLHVLRSLRQLPALAEDLVYPVMVKPGVSRPNVEMKAVAHSPAELGEYALALAESQDAPNVIFQEYIPGQDDWTFTGYFDAGSRCLAGFTGRRLRTLPPHMGHTSLGICHGNPELHRLASGFLTEVGYRGIVDAEFRYDERDRVYKVLDVNPRVGGNFRVFVDVGGMDVVRALYLDLTGMPVPPAEPCEGRLWVKEDSDLISFVRLRRAGELDFRSWVRSLKGVDEGATFAISDPLPFLTAMLMVVLDTAGGRLWRRR